MEKLIVECVGYLLIIQFIWNSSRAMIVRYKLFKSQSNQIIEVDSTEKNKQLFIVIPVLNEQKIIVETLEYFDKLIGKDKNVHLVLVTTDKELTEFTAGNTMCTTNEVISEYIESVDNNAQSVTLINYSGLSGMMAH